MRQILSILVLVFGMPLATADEAVPENAMKAAYLYNFALFTEWPEHSDVLNLCISAEDDLAYALNSIEGREIRGMRLNVMRLATLRDVSNCHILFLGESDRSRARELLNRVSSSPILTVTDVDGMTAQGVMIGILESDKHLAFEINLEASKRAGLALSSKLLRLARRVQ